MRTLCVGTILIASFLSIFWTLPWHSQSPTAISVGKSNSDVLTNPGSLASLSDIHFDPFL